MADKSRPQGSRAASADRSWWQCHVIGFDLCRLQRTVAFSVIVLYLTLQWLCLERFDLEPNSLTPSTARTNFKQAGSVRNRIITHHESRDCLAAPKLEIEASWRRDWVITTRLVCGSYACRASQR